MQRLFSMFPNGWPGIALGLLRVSVAAATLLSLSGSQEHLAAWVVILITVVAAALVVGIMTPIVALLAIAVQLARSISLGVDRTGFIVPLLDALALSLLGPGAYSIDAYFFGRRVVLLPGKDDFDSD